MKIPTDSAEKSSVAASSSEKTQSDSNNQGSETESRRHREADGVTTGGVSRHVRKNLSPSSSRRSSKTASAQHSRSNSRIDAVASEGTTSTSSSSSTSGGRTKRKMSHHHSSRGSKNLNVLSQKGKPGLVTLQPERLAQLVRKEPVEKYYTIEDEPIGSGNFSEVYRCRRKDTGAYYAGKFVTLRRLGANEAQLTSAALHEIAILDACRPCPRMIRLYEIYQEKDRVVLILEYAAGGDFQSVLDEDQIPLESDVARFMRQILDGLSYMHDRHIVHMDIKPQNLVLSGPFPCCDVKLCDFESSRVLKDGDVNEILGTADYVAPEILHFEPITTAADMWSVGVMTYVLLTGCSPFGGETDQETLLNITQAHLDFPEELFAHISKDAQDFIKSLLKKSPSQRPSARECLHHPWLTRRSYRRRKNLYKLAAKPPSMPALPFYKPPSKPPSLPSLLRSSQFFVPSMTASTPSLVTPVMTISTPCLLMSPLGPLSPVNSFRVEMERGADGNHRLHDPTFAFQQTLAAIARSNPTSSSSFSAASAVTTSMHGKALLHTRATPSPSPPTSLPLTPTSPPAAAVNKVRLTASALSSPTQEQQPSSFPSPSSSSSAAAAALGHQPRGMFVAECAAAVMTSLLAPLKINPGADEEARAEEQATLSQSSDLPLSPQLRPTSQDCYASRRSSTSCAENQDNYVSQDSAIEEDRSDLDDLDPETDEKFNFLLRGHLLAAAAAAGGSGGSRRTSTDDAPHHQRRPANEQTDAATSSRIANTNDREILANDIAALNLASSPPPRKIFDSPVYKQNLEHLQQHQHQQILAGRKISPAQEELSVRSTSFEKLLSGFMQRLGQEQNGQSHNRARVVDFCKSPSPSSVSIPPPFAEFSNLHHQQHQSDVEHGGKKLLKLSTAHPEPQAHNNVTTSIRSRVHSWEGLAAGSGLANNLNNKDKDQQNCDCLYSATPAVIEEHNENCYLDTDAASNDSESSSTCSSASTITEQPAFPFPTAVTPTPEDNEAQTATEEPKRDEPAGESQEVDKPIEEIKMSPFVEAPLTAKRHLNIPMLSHPGARRTASAFGGSADSHFVVPCSPRPTRRSSVPASFQHQESSRKISLVAQSMPSLEDEAGNASKHPARTLCRGASVDAQTARVPMSPSALSACPILEIPSFDDEAFSESLEGAGDSKNSKVVAIAQRLRQRRSSAPAGARYWGRICSGSYAKALESFKKKCSRLESVNEGSEKDQTQHQQVQQPLDMTEEAASAQVSTTPSSLVKPVAARFCPNEEGLKTDATPSAESQQNRDTPILTMLSKRAEQTGPRTCSPEESSLLERTKPPAGAASRPARQLR